jgi:hypothetical protein
MSPRHNDDKTQGHAHAPVAVRWAASHMSARKDNAKSKEAAAARGVGVAAAAAAAAAAMGEEVGSVHNSESEQQQQQPLRKRYSWAIQAGHFLLHNTPVPAHAVTSAVGSNTGGWHANTKSKHGPAVGVMVVEVAAATSVPTYVSVNSSAE